MIAPRKYLFAVLVTVALLAGCTTTIEGSASPESFHAVSAPTSETHDTAPPQTSAQQLDARFIAQMREYGYPETDAQLIELAHAVCTELANGESQVAIIAGLLLEFSTEQAGWLAGTAVAAYCPQFH